MRNLLQSMSGVQLRLLWDRNIFIVLIKATTVADGPLQLINFVGLSVSVWLIVSYYVLYCLIELSLRRFNKKIVVDSDNCHTNSRFVPESSVVLYVDGGYH